MSSVLITGVNGFVGSHLAEHIFDQQSKLEVPAPLEVYGLTRRGCREDNLRDANLLEKDHFHMVMGDLTDPHRILEIVDEIRPNAIFHLGAQSYVKLSWNQPLETIRSNVEGTVNLLEAVRKFSPEAIVQVACSSEEYGLIQEEELPVDEDNPLRPLSPYAVTKIAADFIAYQYYRSYGLRVIRTRAFNHTGPRRGEEFVVSTFCKQAAEMQLELKPKRIKVGNLEARRDFTDVRDMVRAYVLAVVMNIGPGPWNISSQETRSMQEVLDMVLEVAGLEDVEIVQDPERMRPSDVPVLWGNSTKFRDATGWEPEIPFRSTIRDTYYYWLRILESQSGITKA